MKFNPKVFVPSRPKSLQTISIAPREVPSPMMRPFLHHLGALATVAIAARTTKWHPTLSQPPTSSSRAPRGSPETQRMRWCVGSAKVECESHPSWRERRRPVRDISRTFPPDERPMLAHPQIHPGGRHDPLKAPALVSGPPVPSRCSLALWGLTSPSSRCPWKKASFAANPFERPVSSHPPP